MVSVLVTSWLGDPARLKSELVNPSFNHVKVLRPPRPPPGPLPSIRHQSVSTLNQSQGHKTRWKVERGLGQGQRRLIWPGLKGCCRGIRIIEDSNRLRVNRKEKIIIPKQPTIRCGAVQRGKLLASCQSHLTGMIFEYKSLQKDSFYVQSK